MDEDIFFAGVGGQAAAIGSGELSSRELVTATLERIQRYDGRLNAFTQVLAEEAIAEAGERDAVPARDRGPLHGVPVAIKEELDVAGAVTTFGGRANVTPATADSEVVRRLRAAGAVVVGKTNMPEFGQVPMTDSGAHGATRNPWDLTRSPGGSSGGTAAAVAAGLVPFGMGGDGGGSIRIPSAACGLFGLKPQRGRVTSAPHPHLWWALGTAGPLTRSVLDSALVYDVVRGSTPVDRWRAGEPRCSFVEAATSDPGRLRVGFSTKPATRGITPDPEHVQAVIDVADTLARLGHHVEEVDPRYPDTTTAFVPQYFAGIRSEVELVERPELLERRTRETARLGAWVRPSVVEWAMRQGEKVSAKANRVFDAVDLLLTPTVPHRPLPAGAVAGLGTLRSSLKALPVVAYAAIWNVAGNPAASVPVGFARDGLPLAVQLVGRRDDEPTILSVAAQLERELPWAEKRPPL
ncbi:MAG: amidase [Actinomycetes bacterium]